MPSCTKQPFNPQQSVVSEESLYPLPLSLPSNPLPSWMSCLTISWGPADVELVTGTSYSIQLCGLRSLTVAIRGTLDWTADSKWAAASALNCENKYWIELRCASQASSPILICLGVHISGSVCLGLRPPHVVAARFFCPGSHFNKTGCWIWGARIQTHFAHVITFPALCPCWGWYLHKTVSLVSGRAVCFRAEREITGVRGSGPLRGRRRTKHLG